MSSPQNTKTASNHFSRAVKFSARIIVSLALLALVYRKVDFHKLVETLEPLTWRISLGIVLLYAVGQLISAAKWQIFLEGIGLVRKKSECLRAYFFGMFVNTFGLGTVGGDVARAIAILPEKGKRAGTLATVVADRIHGLMVLLAIGAVSILFVRPAVLGVYAAPLSLLCLVFLASLYWVAPILLLKFFGNHDRFGNAVRLAYQAFPRSRRALGSVTAISVVFHVSQICILVIIARVLNAPLSVPYLFATVPLVNIASALPLSVSGLGVREALFIFLFTPLGTTHEVCVAMGAVWVVVNTVVSAVGGPILMPRYRQRLADLDTPLAEQGEPR